MTSILEHQSRRFHPELLHGFRRGLPGLHVENAAELPGAEPRDLRESLDRKVLAQMAFGEGERALDAIRFRFELQKRRMLRLAARATW